MAYFDCLPDDHDPDGCVLPDFEEIGPAMLAAQAWLADRGFTVEPHIGVDAAHTFYEVLDRDGKTFAWGKTALAAVSAARRVC